MKKYFVLIVCCLSTALIMIPLVCSNAEEVVRPEEIKSKRLVVYDKATYTKLAHQWKLYYDAYESEYAYANWMYAARYAGDEDYEELLNKGVKKYPANPTLLYLKSLLKHGMHDNEEGRRYLQRAIALDPKYSDPWFSLVIHYMDQNEDEELDVALRYLLESGAVQDEVMDFCYNMLVSLDENAIIITNGDNDTYPVWILQNVLDIRTDLSIINRSLLNTDWYPIYVIKHGAPQFVTKSKLNKLRSSIENLIKEKKKSIPAAGPYSDTLIHMIIESAERANRPVYFSSTLYITKELKPLTEKGINLGLVTLVTKSEIPYGEKLRKVYTKWVEKFRTAGMSSWRLQYSAKGDAGMQLMANYAFGAVKNLGSLKKYAPELRVRLFKWYLDYADQLIDEKYRGDIYKEWCEHSDVKEIKNWCEQKGIKP